MNILLLSRYARLGASSRLRSYQYIPYLTASGWQVTISPFLGDGYIADLYRGKFSLLNIVQSYARRIEKIRTTDKYDLIWVEKEMLPWIPASFEIRKKSVPVVVDYDDAVFHRYDRHPSILVRTLLGEKIDSVMRRADLVIVGNQYLADRACLAGARNVRILPTVVDLTRYVVSDQKANSMITIGWIGSPSTAPYLLALGPVMKRLTSSTKVRFVAIGANPVQLKGLPIEVRPWTEESEVEELQKFDIGIMPLPDEPFERGKCGYKLIQYMACGLPVVASPVGVNMTIVRDGVDGFHAGDSARWEHSLRTLCLNKEMRRQMGASGRKRIEESYSLEVTQERLEKMLRSTALAKRSDLRQR